MAKKTKETSLNPAPATFTGFCPIVPVPKGRPRFARRGNFVQTYTPEATEQYESAVRTWMKKTYGTDKLPMDGAIKASYIFILPKPKSAPKKKLFSNTKPDIDNFIKSFQDALDFKYRKDDIAMGVLANDSRVAALSAIKRYPKDGEQCGTYFSFEIIEE